jgi:PKD repeat protein
MHTRAVNTVAIIKIMQKHKNTLSNRNTVKTMKTLFTSLCVTILATVGLAQSPGGVSSGLVAWLKPDAIAPVADGTAITSWNDASGLANNATQGSAAAKPQYYNNVFNGHAAIRTSSTRFFNIDLSDINDTNYTIITVSKRTGNIGYVVGFNGSTSSTGLALGYAGSTLARHSQYANWVNMVIPANSVATELPVILACQFDELVGKKLWRINDGTNTIRSGTNKTHYVLSGSGRIGRGLANDGFIGSIAEVIVYNRVLTTAELKQLHTYLSVKYGLSVPAAEHLYPMDATHQNDVFGIGYKNAYALNQTSSESAGMDDILKISNPSSINDGDYLICGNDNESVAFSAHVGTNCVVSTAMNRDWKFRHVGDFGTVDLRFDLSGVTGFNASELRLLVDLDGDGYDDEALIEGVYAAPYFTATGVSIPNGAKATLCTVKTHYYAVLSGLTSGQIWADSPTGTPGFLNATCAGLDLTIKSGNNVTNDWTTLTCNNITVEAGAIFLAGALETQNLHVNGNITSNGTWNDGNATLNMEGAAAQTVTSIAYLKVQNWNITNANGVTINGLGVNVYGNLGITGNGVLNTNDKLNLWSDAAGTGEIQSLTYGTINGEVNVRRYRPAATAGWVNLSSSLQDGTIEEWDNTILTTGFAGSDNPSYSFNSVVFYDETEPGTDNDGYVGVSNSSEILEPGKGYMVYMPTGSYTVAARGTINSGNVSLNPSYTPNGSGAGWNMVGNPYPATIDWNALGWTKTNMNNAVYIWRSNINQYASYVNGIASNGGSNLIAPGQSFFVEASGAMPVLMVTEECKSKSPGTFRNQDVNIHQLSIRMQMGEWQDETVLIANEIATKSFDSAIDAKKLRSPVQEAPYMATMDDNGQNLSINSIHMNGDEQIIPIRIEAGVSGVYTIEVTGLDAFAKGACVTLEEVFTHTSYVLTEGASIELPLEAGDHTLRYQLHIGIAALSNVTDAGCSSSQGGSAEVTLPANSASVVEWLNSNGQLFATSAPIDGVAKVESLTAGNYTARITNNGACGTTTYNFEVLQLNKLGASAVVMPASCENTDDGGISINVSGGEAPFSIIWNNGVEGATIENATAGKYMAHIADHNGCEGNFQFEVQSVSNLLSKFEVSHEHVELVNGEAQVTFTNTSENADSFIWNFGDGDESNTENPTHAYVNAGTYEVMLKATYDNCESVSTRTVAVTDNNQSEEFAGDVLATLTDRGVQVTFLFDELKNIRINAYNVLGQQLIEPIVGQYGNQTITFSDRRYAANALIEVTDMNTGEKTLIRLGR